MSAWRDAPGGQQPDRSATAAPSPMGVFAAALLDPRLPPPVGLCAWNGSDPAARFAVYRNNVVHSLVSVLGDTFPVVRQVVGAAFFDAMARSFVRQVLPRSPLMHCYGEPFADWLAGTEPAAALPWLPDLARLEFARLQALHAADASPLAPQVLAHALADPEGLAAATLRLHPSLRVLCSPHAVVSLWSAQQHDDVQRDERLSRMALDVPEAALVLRHDDEVLVIPLPPTDAALVAAWLAGCPLGASLAPGSGADVAGVLALLLAHGAVTGLSPLPGSPIDPQRSEAPA